MELGEPRRWAARRTRNGRDQWRVGVPVLRAAWGALLLCYPERLLSAMTDASASRSSLLLLRLLGARHLCQAAVAAARPSPAVLAVGGATDALHAASCAGLAVFDPRWRRAAALGGLGATAFAVADFTAAYQTVERGWNVRAT